MALPDGGRASSVSVTKRVGPAEAVRAAWYAFSTAMAEGKVSYRRAHANRQFDRRQNAHIIYLRSYGNGSAARFGYVSNRSQQQH